MRSSLASRMAGFIRGGKDAAVPSWRIATVVSTFLDYNAIKAFSIMSITQSEEVSPRQLPSEKVVGPYPPEYPSTPPLRQPILLWDQVATPESQHRSCVPWHLKERGS